MTGVPCVDVNQEEIVLGADQDIRFFQAGEVQYLKIGCDFGPVLNEDIRLQRH